MRTSLIIWVVKRGNAAPTQERTMTVALIADALNILINAESVLITEVEANHTSTCRECKPMK
jgi:hypothetical protein